MVQSRCWVGLSVHLYVPSVLLWIMIGGYISMKKNHPTCLAIGSFFFQGAWPNLPHLIQQGLQFFRIQYPQDEIRKIILVIFNKIHIFIDIFKQNYIKNVYRLEFKGYKLLKIGLIWRVEVKIEVFQKLYNIKCN